MRLQRRCHRPIILTAEHWSCPSSCTPRQPRANASWCRAEPAPRSALAGTTDQIIYLEDGDVADLQLGNVWIMDATGKQVNRKINTVGLLGLDRANEMFHEEIAGYRSALKTLRLDCAELLSLANYLEAQVMY